MKVVRFNKAEQPEVVSVNFRGLRAGRERNRRQLVDNAVNELLQKVLDNGLRNCAVVWNTEIISDVRDAIEEVVCEHHELLTPNEFYPARDEDQEWIRPDLDTPAGFLKAVAGEAAQNPLEVILVGILFFILFALIF